MKISRTGARVLASAIAVISIIFLPYWVYLPIIALSIFVFEFYWEAVILAFLIDALYGTGAWLGIIPFPFAAAASIMVLISLPVRERLRFHA